MPVHDRHVGVLLERLSPREALEEDAAERIHVRGRPDLLPLDLLGRCVVDGPHEQAGRGLSARPSLLGDAEIGEVGPVAVLVDQDVPRLDVAVNEIVGVRRVECRSRLVEDREQSIAGKGALGLDELGQIGPANEPHRDVGHPVGLARVVDRDDVRVLEARDELGLADKSLAEVSVLGVLGEQRLQGRLAPEDEVLGTVDDPHAPLA